MKPFLASSSLHRECRQLRAPHGAIWGLLILPLALLLPAPHATAIEQNLVTQDPAIAAAPSGTAFERVTSGPITEDGGDALAPSWADYDGDGDLDLFITRMGGQRNVLYRNDGSQGFVRITDQPPVRDPGMHQGAGWGDFDHDGRPDLFVNDHGFGTRIYRNLGNGAFAEPIPLIAANGTTSAAFGGWSDFDADGRLDLLVSYGGGADQAPEQLWRQLPDGGFAAVTSGPVVSSAGFSFGASWGDYNNDRLPDLFVGNVWDERGYLFRNLGQGEFEIVRNEPFASQPPSASTGAWADYDNDGDLDLFAAHATLHRPVLYRNEGGGDFVRILESTLVQEVTSIVGAIWGDYDNDGWLDLYIANRGQRNILYRSLGDGSFTPVNDDPAVVDAKASNGCAWGDYDGDGFLDLAVANWDGQTSDLFRNRGNSNAWLKVRCQGTASNASGIGAKVRILTQIQGEPVWQMREIQSGDGLGGPELIAHFGLGNAATVERLVVEWPSGANQEFTDIAGRQVFTVHESPAALLTISPAGGVFTNSVAVTLQSYVLGAEIRYTLDGSEPTVVSLLYSAPILITTTTTLKARLFLNGFPVSEILSATYQADPGIRIEPNGGTFTNRIDVVITSRLPNVQIRYTLDGSEPDLNSSVYTEPIPVTAGMNLRARAYFNDFPVTDVVSAAFQRVYIHGDDGIPDSWREQYFGAEFRFNPDAQQTSDPDRDGSDNRQEYLAGTDPLDPTSGFRIAVRAIPEIRFPSVVGLKYRILRRASLDDPQPEFVQELTADSESTTFVDRDAGVTANPAFYLVEPVR